MNINESEIQNMEQKGNGIQIITKYTDSRKKTNM